jgi:hypothetical protein
MLISVSMGKIVVETIMSGGERRVGSEVSPKKE